MKKIKNAFWRALENSDAVLSVLILQCIGTAIFMIVQYFGNIHLPSVWAIALITTFWVTFISFILFCICQMQSMFDDGQIGRPVYLLLTILIVVSIFWFILPAALWHYFAPPKKDFVVS